jgi:hypothetical protein
MITQACLEVPYPVLIHALLRTETTSMEGCGIVKIPHTAIQITIKGV